MHKTEIGNLGKVITLKDKEYTIFNNDVEHRPFTLKDDKGNVYYISF